MTTQEQLEKVIKKYIGNVPIKGNLDGTQCLYINEGAIIKLASTILLAMRIDRDKLCFILMTSPIKQTYEQKVQAIASHAQEIIKFEEE